MSQKGITHILILLATAGLLAFLFISNTFSFRDKLFNALFPKPSSKAADNLDNPINVGVLVLRYYPLDSTGTKLDPVETGMNFDLTAIRDYTSTINAQGIEKMTFGSRYHFAKTNSIPYLNYSVVDDKEFLKALPPLKSGQGASQPNYNKMLTQDVNVCDYVDNRGVSQVWLWGYHTANIYPVESDMSMGTDSKAYWNFPNYGDISNSALINDLPTCHKTYTLYNYSYSRGLADLLHDHGHQIEVIMGWLSGYLWSNFVEPHGLTDGTINHCGQTHTPPNVTNEMGGYYNSPTEVQSDCEDWKPDGSGEVKTVSCTTWYNSSTCPDDGGASFITWWMQQIPGLNNNLTFQGNALRNWWEFYGNLDAALLRGKFLVQPSSPSPTPAAASLIISNISRTVATNSATISWTTDIASTSRVVYSLTTYLDLGTSTTEDTSLVTSHTVTISGLTKGTVYYFKVFSKNSAGLETSSAIQKFRTKNR